MLALFLAFSMLLTVGCDLSFIEGYDTQVSDTQEAATESTVQSITIINGGRVTLKVGEYVWLQTDIPEEMQSQIKWSASNENVNVSKGGIVTGVAVGKVTVTATIGNVSDKVMFEVVSADSDETVTDISEQETDTVTEDTELESGGDSSSLPEINVSARDEFYGSSIPAKDYEDALNLSQQGKLSGADKVPDQAPVISEHRPMSGGKYIRNSEMLYADENTYIVVDSYGYEVFRVYRGGAYITLEEVAAYVYAFGGMPANYTASKRTKPRESVWGIYLRVNHTQFSGSTSKYPYEPELPRISGCGGDLYYWEMDIGTTGTDCDPGYRAQLYNDGNTITRGAARIVYTRYDADNSGTIDLDEIYVFYTYNHYNDFQEYLNYYGGWGEMFGNVTGGGTLSSKSDYNPTPYVPVVLSPIVGEERVADNTFDPIEYCICILPELLYFASGKRE